MEVVTTDRVKPRRLPGVEGVWVFIGADSVIFAILFLSFMQDRLKNPAIFEASRHTLNMNLGGIDTLILGGDVSGKAVVPVVARPGDSFLIRQFHGERVLSADETAQVETRIRDMGFYPYRTTDEELEEIWDNPEAVHAVFLEVMRETLARWRLPGDSPDAIEAHQAELRTQPEIPVGRLGNREDGAFDEAVAHFP